jgi:hypothetical protein
LYVADNEWNLVKRELRHGLIHVYNVIYWVNHWKISVLVYHCSWPIGSDCRTSWLNLRIRPPPVYGVQSMYLKVYTKNAHLTSSLKLWVNKLQFLQWSSIIDSSEPKLIVIFHILLTVSQYKRNIKTLKYFIVLKTNSTGIYLGWK